MSFLTKIKEKFFPPKREEIPTEIPTSGVQTTTPVYLPKEPKTSVLAMLPSALDETLRKFTAGGIRGAFSKEPAPTWKEAFKKSLDDITNPETSPFFSEGKFNPLTVISTEPLANVGKQVLKPLLKPLIKLAQESDTVDDFIHLAKTKGMREGFFDLFKTNKVKDEAMGIVAVKEKAIDFFNNAKGEADMLLKKLEEFEPKVENTTFNVFDSEKKVIGQVQSKDFYYAEDKAKELFKDKYSHLMKDTATPKLDPLTVEARKYKSAEEFADEFSRNNTVNDVRNIVSKFDETVNKLNQKLTGKEIKMAGDVKLGLKAEKTAQMWAGDNRSINKIDSQLFSESKRALSDFYNQAIKGVGEGKLLAQEFAETPTLKPAINIERLNIPQEAKQKIIKASEEIKPELEKIKGGILSNDEVVEAAQKSEILRKGTTKEATLKSEAIMLKTRQHLAELAKNEKLTPEFIDTLKTVSAEATRRGRELQALGIEADPALGTIKTKIVKQLLDMGIDTDKIIKASEGVDFNNAKQAMDFYRNFIKPKLPQIIDEYRYLNLLSSPKTQIVNTFSNILQVSLLRPATRLFSGITDNIASSLTGKEQEFYIKQVPAYYKGALNSFGDALSEAMKVMRGEQQIYRPDIKNIPTGLKVFKPFQIIPRLMEASDVFFRKIATGGEIEALMSKGTKEAEAVSKAAKTAEELVFRKALDPSNKTGQGILLSKIDALTSAVYKLRDVPGVKWFIPFVQTPMNILKQGIEYSPLGITTLAKNANKIEQFGKTLVGTTVFAGAGWLALKDKTTWRVPTNEKDREAFYAAGMQPYSVKIGDNWFSYSRLGPLAYPLAMAAAVKFYLKDNPKSATDTALQKTTKIFSGIAEFFADQSYVQGIGDFIDIAKGDATALSRALSQLPSQLIPLSSFQRWVATMIDPIYRKSSTEISVEAIIENLKKGIPFLSKQIEPYIDITGEPSKRQYPIRGAFSPVGVSKEIPKFVEHFKERADVAKARTILNKGKAELSKQAEEEYNILKSLSRERAKEEFDQLIKENPALAKEINKFIEKEKLGYEGEFIQSLGVENGQRAKYIFEKTNKLKTKEEKRVYYQGLIDKGVVSKKVNEQVLLLHQGK